MKKIILFFLLFLSYLSSYGEVINFKYNDFGKSIYSNLQVNGYNPELYNDGKTIVFYYRNFLFQIISNSFQKGYEILLISTLDIEGASYYNMVHQMNRVLNRLEVLVSFKDGEEVRFSILGYYENPSTFNNILPIYLDRISDAQIEIMEGFGNLFKQDIPNHY